MGIEDMARSSNAPWPNWISTAEEFLMIRFPDLDSSLLDYTYIYRCLNFPLKVEKALTEQIAVLAKGGPLAKAHLASA